LTAVVRLGAHGGGWTRDFTDGGAEKPAVIAVSYERIHRSNLVGMGVLPLEFVGGQSAESIGLDGTETFDVVIDDRIEPRQKVEVVATRTDGTKVPFETLCRTDTPVEVEYFRNGGILHTVLRRMASGRN